MRIEIPANTPLTKDTILGAQRQRQFYTVLDALHYEDENGKPHGEMAKFKGANGTLFSTFLLRETDGSRLGAQARNELIERIDSLLGLIGKAIRSTESIEPQDESVLGPMALKLQPKLIPVRNELGDLRKLVISGRLLTEREVAHKAQTIIDGSAFELKRTINELRTGAL